MKKNFTYKNKNFENKNYKFKSNANRGRENETPLEIKKFQDERFVVGRNAVRELLRYKSEKIKKIYFQNEESDKKNNEIISLAKEKGIVMQNASKDSIRFASCVDNHQGFLAVVKDFEDFSLKSFLSDIKKEEKEKVYIVAVDSVEDPHNLGTIFRASECFGVDAVLLSKNRGTQITPAVTKSSVGATELVRRIEVSNLLTAVRELKKEGFWIIVADVNEKAVFLNEFEAPKKFVLIMGKEGDGVQKALKEEADFIVKIPQKGKVDSLNVSQATSVILYQLTL